MSTYKFEPVNIEYWQNVPFINDRLASSEDVDLGRAVFRAKPNGEKHIPLDVNIPRLAYHINQETNEKTKGVIIQCEQIGDKNVVGIRYIDGGCGVCLLFELEFIQ